MSRQTQAHEIEAWLGDDTELSTEQRAEMLRLLNEWEAERGAWSDEDWQDHAVERSAEMLAIYGRLAGRLDLGYRARQVELTLRALHNARVYRDAAIRHAVASGMPESAVARRVGLDRSRIRHIMGKI